MERGMALGLGAGETRGDTPPPRGQRGGTTAGRARRGAVCRHAASQHRSEAGLLLLLLCEGTPQRGLHLILAAPLLALLQAVGVHAAPLKGLARKEDREKQGGQADQQRPQIPPERPTRVLWKREVDILHRPSD